MVNVVDDVIQEVTILHSHPGASVHDIGEVDVQVVEGRLVMDMYTKLVVFQSILAAQFTLHVTGTMLIPS